MYKNTKIGLIDGLPFRMLKNMRVIPISGIKYPWDSELFGVPDYRAHADEMIAVIGNENPNSEILVFPFYPKFKSAKANYGLIAQNLENAISHQCQVICICLEVLGVNYLSADLSKIYKKAYEKGIYVCVSAGNHRPFRNPLIHNKYTIPVTGMNGSSKASKPPKYKKSRIHLSVGVGIKNENNSYFNDEKISCSRATAIFAGCLSKSFKKNKATNSPIEFENYFKEHAHETNHFFNFFNTQF